MNPIKETRGTPAEAVPFESILFADISLQILNEGKYTDKKRLELAGLVSLIAESNKLDLDNGFDLVRAKIILTNSTLMN